MTKQPVISVIVPLYKCSAFIEELCTRLDQSLNKIATDYEIILINDCSPEDDWNKIVDAAKLNPSIKGINFSKNFGQHYAITAGLDLAIGKWVVVMDGDLQDQPEEIIKLYNKALEGWDIVMARRIERKDTFFKQCSSKLFYFILNALTGEKYNAEIANFSIIKENVRNAIITFREQNRMYPYLLKKAGFLTTSIAVNHSARSAGKSSYSITKLLQLAFSSIISQSNKPLKIFIQFGLFMSITSLLFGVYILFKKIMFGVSIEGWTSLIVSIYFLAGLLFANLGILGLYLGKVYDETKQKPLYIIKEKIGY